MSRPLETALLKELKLGNLSCARIIHVHKWNLIPIISRNPTKDTDYLPSSMWMCSFRL
ncbi:hypothetical protein CI102_10575 [Trichoderma harzianum]|nr:hypothetical protein CI102_10575 [Trichoderma harzianum]